MISITTLKHKVFPFFLIYDLHRVKLIILTKVQSCNLRRKQNMQHFHHSKIFLPFPLPSIPFPTRNSLATTYLIRVPIVLLFPECHQKLNQTVCRILSLASLTLRKYDDIQQLGACISKLVLFIVWLHHSLLTHSSADEHLDCLQVLMMNKAAESFARKHLCKHVFTGLGK